MLWGSYVIIRSRPATKQHCSYDVGLYQLCCARRI